MRALELGISLWPKVLSFLFTVSLELLVRAPFKFLTVTFFGTRVFFLKKKKNYFSP